MPAETRAATDRDAARARDSARRWELTVHAYCPADGTRFSMYVFLAVNKPATHCLMILRQICNAKFLETGRLVQ